MNALIPALCITLGPILALAPVVYALRPQGGRHTGLSVKVVAGWSPFDGRVRAAIAHFAAVKREPGLGEIADQQDDIIWTVPATDRDMTGAFPVLAVTR